MTPGCPHCGCTTFVRQYRVTGTITIRERADGDLTDIDNTGMWDSVITHRTRKLTRCEECEEPLRDGTNKGASKKKKKSPNTFTKTMADWL